MASKKWELLMSVVLIFCACILAEKGWERASSRQVTAEDAKWTVVLDAGHGGTFTRPKKSDCTACGACYNRGTNLSIRR